MITKQEILKQLNSYSKEQIINACIMSTAATAFILNRCKCLYGAKTVKEEKKEKPVDGVEEIKETTEAVETTEPATEAVISQKKPKKQ